MIIVLVCNIQEHPKVPPIQKSTATAQNILLALYAMGFAGIGEPGKIFMEIFKLTGLEKHQSFWIFICRNTNWQAKDIPTMQVEEYVEIWN